MRFQRIAVRLYSQKKVVPTYEIPARLKKQRSKKTREHWKHGRKIGLIDQMKNYSKWNGEGRKFNMDLYYEYFNSCLEEIYREKDHSYVLPIFEKLKEDVEKEDHLSFDVNCWNMYLQCAIRIGDFQKVSQIWNQIPEDVQKNQITYGAMIRACALQDLKEEAREYWQMMMDAKLASKNFSFEDTYESLKQL